MSFMSNKEHLSILREGVETWNRFRGTKLNFVPKLSGAKLIRAKLSRADLSEADLSGAKLREADLSEADLSGANLMEANLSGANLMEANLREADLSGAKLIRAKLSRANLSRANLMEADLSGAGIGWTAFTSIDLSNVQGLEAVYHFGPSTIGIDTIYLSKGEIPHIFLEKAGIPDTFIDYISSLVGKAIEYYSCFISYSSKNEDFAQRLYADLQTKGIRCWFAPEDMKIGEKIRESIDRAIRLHDKLLLVLSNDSVNSDWVEKEVETAFEKESKRKDRELVLFPIRIDDAVMKTDKAWAADIRRGRHIGDFRNWKDHDSYKGAFDRLLRDLKQDEASSSSSEGK